MANRLLNFKPSEKSKSHVRVIDEVPEALFEKLEAGKELEFAWIEVRDLEPAEEARGDLDSARIPIYLRIMATAAVRTEIREFRRCFTGKLWRPSFQLSGRLTRR